LAPRPEPKTLCRVSCVLILNDLIPVDLCGQQNLDALGVVDDRVRAILESDTLVTVVIAHNNAGML
jgi:hypothetical protein